MSRLPFEVFLALRYLRPKRTFVSVITLISILGVTLGVGVLIIVISVMSGFDRELRERIFGFTAHLTIVRAGNPMTRYADVQLEVAKNPRVHGVSPFVLGPVMLRTQPQDGVGERGVATPWLRSSDPATEGTVSVLTNSIVAGRYDLSGHDLIVGTKFAELWNLQVGDHVAIYSPRDFERIERNLNATNETREAVVARDFKITGIFDVGYYEYNATVIASSLEDAQELYGLDKADSVHGLLVKLDDPYHAAAVRDELEAALGPGYRVSTWMEGPGSTLLGQLTVEKNVMFYILIFIMIVAAFGITSSQITFVVQKTREIGMLKALGATTMQIMALFVSQTLAIGSLGVLGGYGFGMLAIAYRNEFLNFMDHVFHRQLFPPELYGFTQLPALIVGPDIAIVCGVSFLICVLAGLIPAWSAGRLKPVEALRHE